MTTEVQPLPKSVKDEVQRHRSVGRFAGPVFAALFHIVMFLAICGGCAFGGYVLWTQALKDPRFHMDGDTLGIGGAVLECPESVGDISAISQKFHGRSLLDPMLIGDLEKAYQESVWVRKVSRMRRNFPNRIDLELHLRLPAAQVRSNQRYWMVDMDGILLPVEGSPQPFVNLPEIVGVTARVIGNRPMPGETWTDEGVVGGLGILRAFWGSPLAEALPVSRVVVNTGIYQTADKKEKEVRRRFEVVTASGAVVRWGTFNAINAPDELTSAEKMWNLQELLRRDEALRSGVCFDVRTKLPGFSLIE